MSSLVLLSFIGLVGFLCQWFSQRVKLPAILFLLLSGIFLGPVLSILDPDKLFGDLLFPYISLSVAVILFEGALTLKRNELTEIGGPVRRMVTIGVVINGLIMTIATHYLIGLSWSLSALFGAIMVVTGPTVIMPMLKAVRVKVKIADVLRWEGIVIDPIGALIAVLIFEWISVQQSSAELSEIFYVFGATVLVGFIFGLLSAYLFGLLLRHHWIPENLQNFASLAVVCFVFAASDSLMHESGLLAVTVMGIVLANMKDVHVHSILEFKEHLTVVFVSTLFIVLAARLDFQGFAALGLSAVLLLAVMQFLARPLKVLVSFLGSGFSWQEQAMVSWIGPRGIVAAAVSAVFALRLEELGIDGADKLVPLAFSIIIGTVVFQSLTARPMANLLNVALPPTHGVMIIGANAFSIAVAKALNKADVETIICDSSWDNISAARIDGLMTYYGNPSSEHAAMHLNLTPYGYMLGLSNHFEFNATQASNFTEEFGARNVFTLPANERADRFHKHVVSERFSGRLLFDKDLSYRQIRGKLRKGAGVKVTELSDDYGYENWLADNNNAHPLLALQPNGDLVFSTINTPLIPESGHKLIYLTEIPDQNL